MKLFNGIPLYEAIIANEECGVYKVSCVTDPATEVNWVAFDENKPIVKFSVDDKKERMITGVIMLAESPIYRRTADNYEYYVVYSKETLKQMAEKMIFDGVGSNINIQHQDGTDVDGVNLVELYVIDREKGIAPTAFESVPNGSLMATYKVHNDSLWEMIENGDVLSFSLEGIFQMEETFNKQEKNNNQINKKYMSKLNRIKQMLKSILVEFGTVATDKGTIVWDGDEELKEGMSVHTVDEEGNEVALEDGVYTTEDKKLITIADGKVVSIEDVDAEVATDEPAAEEPQENAEEEPSQDEEPETEVDEKDERIAALELENNELKVRIAELEAENEELKAKVAELEKDSAAPSAEEAFEKLDVEDNTKVGKMSKRGYKFN